MNVLVSSNPKIQQSLGILRNRNTSAEIFRKHSDIVTELLLEESVKITQKEPIVISILRAGLAMLPAALKLFPKAPIGLIGLERNEETAVAREYYSKIPKTNQNSNIIVLDPMLATGGSVLKILQKLHDVPQENILIVCVIAAPEGVKALEKEFPDVQVLTAALDSHLDSKKYIVPGLGDYGDRYFGT